MFQKVTQKVWFVVLVGLLLGLACGAVMAWWPGLRGVAAGVAVVGVLLLGRTGGAGGWLSLPVAAGVSAIGASLFVSRRWGFPVALVVAVASLVVGGIWGLWEAVRRRGARPDRNASVHPNGIPKYQSPPTDKNARIERLAVLLHNAGRSAVEPSGAFVEWDDAPERTRAGRRSQAQYLLAAGVVLPVNAAPPAGVKPSRVGEIVFRDGKPLGIMCEDGEVRPGSVMSKGKGELFFSRDDLRAKIEAETAPPSADAEQIKRDCARAAENLKSDPKLADDAKAHLDIAAKALGETLRKSPFYVADDEREVTLIAQRPKFSKAYFLARIGADACYRLPDGKLDVKTANRALYDAFKPLVEGELLPPVEHTPAPITTQIAQQAADREAAAK